VANNLFQGDGTEVATVRTFVGIVTAQKVVILIRKGSDAFDHMEIRSLWVEGNNKIARHGSFPAIGSRVNQHLITGVQEWKHRGSGDALAFPEPQKPKQ